MTHNTDAERADTSVFKQLLSDYMECLLSRDLKNAGAAREALIAEYVQAARRAPAAPVPTEQQILDAAEKAGLWPNTVHTWIPAFKRYHAALSAAPQPPEAAPDCLTCNDHGSVGNILNAEPCPDCTPAAEAAPVQMPEPFAWTDDGTLRAGSSYTAHRVVTSDTKRTMHSGTAAAFHEPLYTDQQVRALLASINHCPKT